MPLKLRAQSKRGRTVAAILIAWALCAAVVPTAKWLAWEEPGGYRPPASITNAIHIAAAPGWAASRLAFGPWRSGSPAGSLLAGAVAATIWLGGLACLVGIRAAITRPSSAADARPIDASRRAFLVNGCYATGALSVGAVGLKATALDPWRLELRRHTIPIADLPEAFDGLRIAFYADPHMGYRVPESFVRKAIQRTLDLEADLIVLGGDYIDHRVSQISRVAQTHAPLAAPREGCIGAVGVLGNHDWYGNGPRMRAAMQRIGVRMLDNGRIFIDAATRTLVDEPTGGPCLCIAGLGDLQMDTVDVDAALAGVNPDIPRILVAHQPDSAELPALRHPRSPRVDLMLSGHTHGGQVRLPFLGTPVVPSRYGQKYAGGLVQAPRFPVLISRGVGMSILPLRLGVPPEIVELTLTRA